MSSPPKAASPKGASPRASSPQNTGAVVQGPLEVDDADDGADSIYGDGESDTTSISSSIFKFREEHGRTYHAYKAGAYFMPNDSTETNRLDLQHNLCILCQENRLFTAPISADNPPKRVLDAGCGTGIWAIEFADQFPGSAVVGVDLSPIQPDFVPPNVEFFVDDLEEEWTYQTPFDFVYMRLLTGSILNWPKLFGQTFKNLNPGGYIELFDTLNPLTSDDNTLPADSAILKWNTLLVEASQKIGRPLDSLTKYKDQLTEAGFVNIVESRFKWPMNTWPKDPHHKLCGAWTHENFLQGVQAVSLMLFSNVLGWSKDEIELLLVDVRKDVKNRQIHAYWPVHVVYAQKPEESES